ncbi:MAG: hypothetical protein PHV98_00595 [Candidatus Omnitrophica bacterium]|nr:hypothetical protein [Candidatus Omnitrophota bacterium]
MDEISLDEQIKAVENSIGYFYIQLKRYKENMPVKTMYKKHLKALRAVLKTLEYLRGQNA